MVAARTLQEDERRQRTLLVARLGWQAAEEAEALIKSGMFKDWSMKELVQRHRELTSKLEGLPQPTLSSSGYRIDNAYIQWERKFGAEVRALEYQMYHPFR